MEILTIISLIFVCGLSSFFGAKLAFRNVKWTIREDKTYPNTFKVEPDRKKQGKVEFLPDATQEELEEMQMEPKWRKFLNSFKKI